MPIDEKELCKFSYNNVFVETGTNNGDSVQTALDVGFKKIYSIEFYKHKVKKAKDRFKDIKYVEIIEGDSGVVLKGILKQLYEPATFWLDSHFSCDSSTPIALADTCPVLNELYLISEHYIKTHTLLIDDKRLFDRGINSWNNIITTDIDNAIKRINPNYNIYYIDGFVKDDVIVAEINR